MINILSAPGEFFAAVGGLALLAYFFAFYRVMSRSVADRELVLKDPGAKRGSASLVVICVAIAFLPSPYKALAFIVLLVQAVILGQSQDRRLGSAGASPSFLRAMRRATLLSYIGILSLAVAFAVGS